MNEFAIIVDRLSKKYRIGKSPARSENVRHTLLRKLTAPFSYLSSTLREPFPEEILWALKDVSFEVKVGEAVGIIGYNGAGKSTLLKILSRITEPTDGRALIQGRVGSLLEVGTGFHPELTGRENIRLSGTIFGMKRSEIDHKFNEIVEFAGIERFLDTQVKRYSSGMYVRLAFAVAAHLEPEVLLVDEVLAVGDAAFQKKCLGKMGDVAKTGRTVLFVSHNMVAMQNLCERAIWLDGGKIRKSGSVSEVVTSYLSASSTAMTEAEWADKESSPGNDSIRLRRVSIRPLNGSPADTITTMVPIAVEFEYWNLVPEAPLYIVFRLYTEDQIVVFSTASYESNPDPLPVGLFRSVCHIPGNLLNVGTHQIALQIKQRSFPRMVYQHQDVLTFDVIDLADRSGSWYGREPGVIHPNLQWKTERLSDK